MPWSEVFFLSFTLVSILNYTFLTVDIFFLFFICSPMTRKKFVLSKHLGRIERNSTGHIVGAEATTILYGITFKPKLNPKEGRLVSSDST